MSISPKEQHTRPRRQRGGRRPGAGAPTGNLNAYRHGKYSRQQKELTAVLAAIQRNLPQRMERLLAQLIDDAALGREVRHLGIDLQLPDAAFARQVRQLRTDLDDLKERVAYQEDFEPAA